ncbi:MULTISPECIES: carbohydrate ABC transporter permease [Microbacteriaceae]|jgi:raffinose/stachyose/melibiose transport system permease protein|uniref:Carbohydrate ABC transporter membrane protein 1, CUT1 family n=1 Tax=Okibacterium fritillariae TaxID=123320 RepID=A0A1T5ICQ2_9MICO|nr:MULTISPECIES: sugar ABC transporter permease [Microbacteriaceae]ONI60768.1 ABC transporter permease [Leifsonia sp. ALI-44-B]SKC36981.1 carbohydrate ABC transporter membrane protein 1, CUT1 family [Okibacterium fritillariae]
MNKVLGDRRAIFLLLGPALLVYTVVMLVPIFWSMGYTVFDGNALTGFTFVGLDNFAKFFGDPTALSATWFTIRYAIILTVLQVGFGYLLALLYTFRIKRASSLIRTIFFFPVVLPTVGVGLLFQKLFEAAPTTGPVNGFLNFLGAPSVDWFGYADSSFWVVILLDLWRSMGFYAILLYAGLVDIPEELLESARIDGASGWKLVRSIVLPLSLPVLLSSLIFSINGTLKVFDTIVALTNGGPGNTTTPLTLYMFQTSFSYGEYGYGSTIAMMLTILCLLVTLLIFRSTRRDLTKG